MRRLPFLSLGFSLLATIAAAQDSNGVTPRVVNEAAVPAVMEKAVDGFIRPGYLELMETTEALSEASHLFCENPSEESLGNLQLVFDDIVQKWSTIEIVRVGPVLDGNRFERFLFFPDRKSTGLKQVQRILATKDETATNPETLKIKSVAVQGLGALEYVLYGTGAEDIANEPNGFRCRYAAAIADNLVEVATDLHEAWEKPDGVQADWKKPGPDNPVFRDNKEAVTALLGVLVHGVETVKDQRIRPFYAGIVNGVPDKGHPKLALYWRSGNTMPSLHTNFEALETLFDAADMRSLLPADSKSVASSAKFVFKSLVRVSEEVDLPIDEAIVDDEQRAKLDFIVLNTDDLLQRLNKDFGGAIGLSAGFSFSDGD
ncbi:putative lipoprotein [Pararhizobium capsulatum DSM 1112]|uniref:Lipoprotein n=1 Tax=Pararhizobium capsulatum DSM 1112 TaxID=1121113 RepID=A0ABU0BMI5_9HYPH|nr:imelysin family protein [Pararhizobium capsulatum]MDQ0318665.1 putative lipoprotein [Pararhizobium capsulatum DSM 1112]